MTQNIKKRMNVLKPDEIIKVLSTNQYEQLERKLHKKFKDVRIPQSEYFRLSECQLKVCKNDLSISSYRRARCSPWLIGVVAGLISPITSIVWGFRQKSWKLAVMPISTVAIASFFYGPFDFNERVKHLFNAGGGLIALKIAKSNKDKAI
ncbi:MULTISPECIES: GIY-YIG nuclease family protein [Prochlorococcus]|uniref:GIY-YIG nuclease family protein n=1 Tax=Prochlorococcus marinus TaxID=1219 RepID=UPI001F1ABF9C